jgi:hypothetical protein
MSTNTEKKSVNILVNDKGFDLSQVIEPVYELKFKKISDGGPSNQATFEFEGVRHTVDFEGVTLGQLFDFALGQIRITLAAPWRKLTKSEFQAQVLGQTTRVKDLLGRVTVRTVDPVSTVEKMTVDQAKVMLEALQAKMAGAPLTEAQTEALRQAFAKPKAAPETKLVKTDSDESSDSDDSE